MIGYFAGLAVIFYLAYSMAAFILFVRETDLAPWQAFFLSILLPPVAVVAVIDEGYNRWKNREYFEMVRQNGVVRAYEASLRQEHPEP